MIAFGAAMTDPEAFRRYARPGIELAAEPDSQVLAYAATGSVCRSYNLVLERAASRDDLEALVLVQQDVEIADPDLCAKVRRELADPAVAVVGAIGASGVRGIAWWDGAVSRGPVRHRYQEHGGGEIDAFAWADPGTAPAEVETVQGSFMVLSPWAVRNVRFDEELVLGTGYDFDFCQQVRAAGRKVMTADFRLVNHHRLELVRNRQLWIEAHIRVADKWEGRLPGGPPATSDWKQRARRAEAERDAARTIAYSTTHSFDARVIPLEREFERITETVSWRLTAPLRALNQARRALAARRRG